MTVKFESAFTETLGRQAIREIQLKRLQLMLEPVLAQNDFYKAKLGAAGLVDPRDLRTIDDLAGLPLTTKRELAEDQVSYPPYGSALTYPRQRYTRIHQTSGTTGEPLRWLDTDESWDWWARCWATVYRAVGVTPADRIFFAFSFGPFIGFWSAFAGASLVGGLAVPGGGMTSLQRARVITVNDISVLVCTPTYALHLAEVAEQNDIDIAGSKVAITIHAGEPGASILGTKRRIESAWGARSYDHAGATEVGAWGFECQAQAGLHINEGEFIAEVLDPVSLSPSREGELVITNLGRVGMPVIRYRTGDHVRLADGDCDCGRTYQRLAGGVIGRTDDAVIVRGVNVFPSAIEEIVRRFHEVGEFAVEVRRRRELDEILIRVEVDPAVADETTEAVGEEIRNALGLRAAVRAETPGTLPRFDLKARRFNDLRERGDG